MTSGVGSIVLAKFKDLVIKIGHIVAAFRLSGLTGWQTAPTNTKRAFVGDSLLFQLGSS
jgi:hypothetical protein